MKELYSNADDCYELTKMLRNKLGIYRNLIVTVRRTGYKFEEE